MKTHIKNLLLLLLLLGVPGVVQAQNAYSTNADGSIYTYSTNADGSASIVAFAGPPWVVTIPININGLTVTSIGEEAFAYTSLTTVTIPSSVTSIGYDVFDDCTSLTNIAVDAANPAYSSLGGVLFDKAQVTLLEFPGGLGGSYTITNSVTTIGEDAFDGSSLTSVTIPDTVTSIGQGAFADASLNSVTIGNGVTSIGGAAFFDCSSLTSVTIPNGVTTIGDGAFEYCFSLASVTIPNSVTSIGAYVFDFDGLTSVTIGTNVTSIGDGAFEYCFSLTSVTIPNSVTNIGSAAFSDCTSLTAISVAAQNPVYSSVNGVLFDKGQATLLQFPAGLGGSYTIPSSVTSIGADAFDSCPNLARVTIGTNVTSIGDDAFASCYSLASVTIPNSVTSIGHGAFAYCNALTYAYFLGNAPPDDGTAFSGDPATVYYLPGKTGWDSMFGGAPAVLCPGCPMAASPPGDVVGKVTVGYQGWFACVGDGAPIDSWWHYSGGSTPTPITLTNNIHCWPDMRQFSGGYQTGFANFANGQPATLFSSYDQQTVNTHFRWMAENGIDTAALQRFNPYSGTGFTIGGEGPTRNDMAVKVMNAAQTYGVKFYIMYDVSGWTSNAMPAQIEYDWTNIIPQLQITNSPMYAMQNGKPVVCIWGFGFNDSNHPWDAATCASIINWFKSQGCYVIGGVPTWWRTGVSDSQNNFLSAYSAFNMISPWMVGRIGNTNDVDDFLANPQTGDLAYCYANGIDYQPCVLPGDTGQRAHGDFMWRQFADLINLGVQGIYISMFDEFNEGNQIACTAENASMEPVGSTNLYFTLDQDGVPCSADYYLRLTGDGDKMLKGQIAFTFTRPTVPMLPLVFPTAPTNLTAAAGNGRVTLNWSPVTGAADVLSYNVRRAVGNGGNYSLIATNVGLVGFTDTRLINGTNYYYVVSAVNSLGESTNSIAVSITPQTTYAVNSGGGAASPFIADAFFSGGSTGSTSAVIDTSGVTNPAPQAVYQTERWNNNTYTFTNLNAGANYKVRLHFAEIFYSSAGVRVFNVFINGKQVLTNYDIFAAAGAENRATLKECVAAASGTGQIAVQYVNIPGKDNAKSGGLEILPLPAPAFASLTINNGALQMTVFNLTAGGTVVLQASTNLQNWVSIQTNAVNSSIFSLTNPINQSAQFLRVLEH